MSSQEEINTLVLPLPENQETIPLLLDDLRPPASGVLPFVGAGLSIPCGMPGWSAFLRQQAHIVGGSKEEEIERRLVTGEYEEAAQDLLEARGEFAFAGAIRATYGETRLRDKSFARSAAAQVHRLTAGPVITTNFDRVLEMASDEQGTPFTLKVWGELAQQGLSEIRKNRRVLVKLHGDAEDSGHRVLTRAEYERYYGTTRPEAGGIDLDLPLPLLLHELLLNRPLLFLGCSLVADRTLRVLEQVSKRFRTTEHYAIVEAPPTEEERQVRSRFLGDSLHIHPIWYPHDRHDLLAPLLAYLASAPTVQHLGQGVHTVGEVIATHTPPPAEFDPLDTEVLVEFDPPGIPYFRVQLNVHKEYSLDLDDYLDFEFQNYNRLRVSRELIPYYPGIVYRVLRPPLLTHDNGTGVQFELSMLNFAYYALLRDDNVSSNLRTYIMSRIANIANLIPDELSSNHPYINSSNAAPLGMIIVLITRDDYTLFRRRGKSVLDGSMDWDVSFGGYCEVEEVEQDVVKIEKVAEVELKEELARILPHNPNKLRFTGVCRNNRNSAIDILGYWKLDATAEQLRAVINIEHPNDVTRVFETTQMADEQFVHDTHNLIVKCNTDVIEQALQQAGNGRISLIPEARMAINLALRCKGERYLRSQS